MLRGSAGTIVGIQRPWARLALGTPAAPWSPTDLGSKLGDWLTADRSDLITLSGSQVTSWAGTQGVVTVTQSTGGLRPLYSATGWNSVAPAVTADGTDDYLEMAGIPASLQGNGSFEYWALVDQQTAAASAGTTNLFSLGNTFQFTRTINRAQVAGANTFRSAQGNGASAPTSDAPGDFSGRHVARGIFTATTVEADLDAVAGTPAASNANIATNRLRLFASSASSPSQYFKGPLRDLILVIGSLTAGEVAQMYAFLNGKL